MSKLLAVVLLLILAVVAVGFWRGWFDFDSKKEDGKLHADFSLNKEKFKQDKENLKMKVAEKSKALKDKLASLRDKTKALSGDAKVKADKEIADLTKKHEALDAKLKDIEDSSEEKFESLKRGVAEAVDEPANDIGKEAEKPR